MESQKSFQRLTPRESSAIVFYRYHMHISISHIAKLVERSTRTVHRVLCKNSWVHKLFDKRHYHPYTRRMGKWWFQRKYAVLSWFYELWKDQIIGNISLLDGHTTELKEGEPP